MISHRPSQHEPSVSFSFGYPSSKTGHCIGIFEELAFDMIFVQNQKSWTPLLSAVSCFDFGHCPSAADGYMF